MTRELAVSLLAAWLASWAAEERALSAAALAELMAPAAIRSHLVLIEREREQLGRLLNPARPG